jgi:hypothetical protein
MSLSDKVRKNIATTFALPPVKTILMLIAVGKHQLDTQFSGSAQGLAQRIKYLRWFHFKAV